MLLYWSKATALGTRKNREEEEEQDAKLSIPTLLRSSQIAALSPLKEQMPVKLTSNLILHSLQTSKKIHPSLAETSDNHLKLPTEWGHFRQASTF